MVTDCYCILAGWRNHFSYLFNVRGVSDVRQTEIHTAEPLVPEPSAFEVEKEKKILPRKYVQHVQGQDTKLFP